MVSLGSRSALEKDLFRDGGGSSLFSLGLGEGAHSEGGQLGVLRQPREGHEGAGQEPKLPEFPFSSSSPFSPTLEDIEEFLREKMELVKDEAPSPREEPSPQTRMDSPPCGAPLSTDSDTGTDPGTSASQCTSRAEESPADCRPLPR
ncbi:unnamed protein product [Tetraodon nigroviridis]|uniref:(spotted green pufferfish) hypothetical protein n=1 Tax=Tetraodon nigroviridis TaxID=99883 RepID=Q4SQX4_TETNG|nr:unnamed protein product [Tetraodon nigroviridis]